jgi:hypothetical protein
MAAFRLKLRKSKDSMNTAITEDVKKFLTKRKQMARHCADALKLQEIANRKALELQNAKEKELALQSQKASLEASLLGSTRAQGRREEERRDEEAMRDHDLAMAETERKLKEAAEEKKRKGVERREALRLQQQALAKKRKAEAEAEREASKKKKSKRTDTSLLISETPRNKAETDPAWAPPRRLDTHALQYSAPGKKWKDESIRKLQLLTTLRHQLIVNGILGEAMTFSRFIEFIEPEANVDRAAWDFDQRVFLFLVGLMLNQKMWVAAACLSCASPVLSSNLLFCCQPFSACSRNRAEFS